MLSRNDDRVHVEGDRRAAVLLILDRDMGLRVGAETRKRAVAAGSGQRGVEFVSKHDSEQHISGVSSVAYPNMMPLP